MGLLYLYLFFGWGFVPERVVLFTLGFY
jgi:hypothetical protein